MLYAPCRLAALLAFVALALSACSSDPAPALPPDLAPDLGQDLPADAAHDAAHDAATDQATSDQGREPTDMEPALLDPQRLSTAQEAFDRVDPFIGTGGAGYGFSGLTPAAQLPLGLVRLGPDTTRAGDHPGVLHFGGYNMSDPHVRGFSHTHFVGTGVADWGHIRVSPRRSLDELLNRRYHHALDKTSEQAQPGYYQARLLDPEVRVELTASTHGGAHRYTFAQDGPAHLALDMAASLRDEGVEDTSLRLEGQTLVGWVRYRGAYIGRRRSLTIHVIAQPTKPAASVRLWDAQGLRPAGEQTAQGVAAGAVWSYQDVAGQPLELRVALSVVDEAQAWLHMTQVDPQTVTLEQLVERARQAWLPKLGRVRVAGGTDAERTIFFTALYNAYRMPTTFTGQDGRYLGLDGQVHQASDFTYYTDLSLWDTFRTLHPWYMLVDHQAQRDSLRSLMVSAEHNGVVPRWPAGPSYTGGMIGTSADMLFGESAAKGLEGIDWSRALELLLVHADGRPAPEAPFQGRAGIEEYLQLGYVPIEAHGDAPSVSLEYAYNDWALAQLARVVGRANVEQRMRQRAMSYKNLFEAESGFMRARAQDGSWVEPFEPSSYAEGSHGFYTEGTAWHWSFYAPHDIEGLRALYGAERFDARVEELFARSALGRPGRVRTLFPDRYYWHGNEPALHSVYLFHASKRPDRLGYWLDQIRTRLYLTSPDGLPGNDDGGTLSAWYLFSALGLYPIAGDDRYWWGSPIFTKAEIELGSGQRLTIEAPLAGPRRRMTRQVWLGQTRVQGSELRHAQLLGATLRFEMAPLP